MGQQLKRPLSPPAGAEEARDFYDRYPYPPTLDNLDNYLSLWRHTRWAHIHLSLRVLFLPLH